MSKERAFVLINVAAGSSGIVSNTLANRSYVNLVHTVYGPYDIIVVIDAKDRNELGSIVLKEIHSIPGVLQTITCLCTPDENERSSNQ
jgi:DNA-binding Lrp family transcriptional regulator